MAQATLNPAIEGLDNTSTLYDLYTRLYDGITSANSVDTPSFVADPIYEKNEDGTDKLDKDGAKIVDTEAMAEKMSEYSTILRKNSAYMMANAIISSIGEGTGGSGGKGDGYLSRSGDTMQGPLGALYGFEAGSNNVKIFETIVDSEGDKYAIVSGQLKVDGDSDISGQLNLSNNGVYFGGNQTIWLDESTLRLASQEIGLQGEVSIDGSFQIGDVKVLKTGITYADKYTFYHGGNSNMDTVDWTMQDAFVKRNLYVSGASELTGELQANGGFVLAASGHDLLYSEAPDDATPYMTLNSDLSIVNNHGIKFNDNYIVWVRSTDDIVSFSAPGAVMNLGDKGTDVEGKDLITQYIALQTDIKNFNGAYSIVGHDGSGNFPNGFSIGAANALGATFQTYYTNSDDYGVVVKDYLRFNAAEGPALSSDGAKLNATIPYTYVADSTQHHNTFGLSIYNEASSSLTLNPTADQAITAMCFNTDAKHFSFGVPVEATKFAIKSSKYKTQLDENVLFFSDGVFLEGLTGGMRLSGNSLFDSDLYSFNPETSSSSFSSGFAGSGWAIMKDVTSGDVHATFDTLTIRKKMRVYEEELQKASTSSGSLWISDSCSGDEVKEIV